MRLGLGFAAGQRFQAEGDIVEDGEMREQREVLEHEPDPALLRRHEAVGSGDLLAVEQHAARGRALDAGGDPEQGRLAAARRPEQAEDLRRRDVEADAVEREHVAIAARQILEGEARGEGDGGLAARGSRAAACRPGRATAPRLQELQHGERSTRLAALRATPSRHGRACPGHPRFSCRSAAKTWMPGTRPGMTVVMLGRP